MLQVLKSLLSLLPEHYFHQDDTCFYSPNPKAISANRGGVHLGGHPMVCASPSPAPRRRWHRQFLALLPQNIIRAKIAFRHLKPEARLPEQRHRPEPSSALRAAFVASRSPERRGRPRQGARKWTVPG